MKLVLRYERDGVRVKRTVDVQRVRRRRGVVEVKVNRRKVRLKGVEDSQLEWESFMSLLGRTLKKIVQGEPAQNGT